MNAEEFAFVRVGIVCLFLLLVGSVVDSRRILCFKRCCGVSITGCDLLLGFVGFRLCCCFVAWIFLLVLRLVDWIVRCVWLLWVAVL